jgi:hypothetical protein
MLCSAELYIFLPTPPPDRGEPSPFTNVKVFSKTTNQELREFEILWCLDGFVQPVVVP